MKYNKKLCIKTEAMIYRGKVIKAHSEVKSFENISKYPQSFLEISSMQTEILQDHAYE